MPLVVLHRLPSEDGLVPRVGKYVHDDSHIVVNSCWVGFRVIAQVMFQSYLGLVG